MSIDSTDTIRRRLVRNASKIWGFKDVQDIHSFDPVLNLIFGALAQELHGISNQISRTEERIVEKLLELLFAQNVYSHFPAHAVAKAFPLQPSLTINENYQFQYIKSIQDPENREVKGKKSIYFTPVSEVKLFNGALKFILSGRNLFKLENQSKELVKELEQRDAVSYSSIFIGLELDQSVQILDGLSLYFSFKSLRSNDPLYQMLNSASWKLNGNEVDFTNGFIPYRSKGKVSVQDFVHEESNTTSKVCEKVIGLYEKNFVTLSGNHYSLQDFLNHHYSPVKEHIIDDYSDTAVKNIIWIELCTAHPISVDLIDDLTISMNSFPVLNREINEFTFTTIKGVNVIPLLTNDLFFDIQSVTDSRDRHYVSSDYITNEMDETPSYVIRQGGIARFDSRDAHEMIADLLGYVRDEAAGFSILGGDLVSNELMQIDQILTRLKERLGNKSGITDQNSYLLFNSENYHEKVSVKYWTTVGELANQIRTGSKLGVKRGYDIDEKSIMLLSHTRGGRQKQSKEDKLNTLRKELLAKGSISTRGDIKALCTQLFGKQILKIDIRMGAYSDQSLSKGYVRSMDIHLTLIEQPDLQEDEMRYKVDELLLSLKKQSMNVLPYRIFINDALKGQSS